MEKQNWFNKEIAEVEKDLKTKLLFNTSGHMTEEILLLKNFKYFILNKYCLCKYFALYFAFLSIKYEV